MTQFKTLFSIIALLTLTAVTSNLFAQSVIRGPYLQMPNEQGITVHWRTNMVTDSKVNFGIDQNNLDQQVSVTDSATEHIVTITGLEADTRYYYSVGTTTQELEGPSAIHWFRTSPTIGDDRPFRVWAIGDFGKVNTKQIQVRQAFEAYSANDPADLWLWLGDNAYDDGTDSEYQAAVFDETDRFGLLLKNLPFWSTPGNHDYNSINRLDPPEDHEGPYFEIMDVPTNAECGGLATGTELYYSFDYANTHFISLNSELVTWVASVGFETDNPMITWLRQDLAANQLDWTVVYFHQPPYSKGSHDSDDFWEIFIQGMRENYVPVFDEFGVDLVLSGHSHVFERSYKIREHYGDSDSWNPATMLVDGSSGNFDAGEAYTEERTAPTSETGTVYIVCGNSGSSEGDPAGIHPVMYYSSGCDTCIGSVVIDVDGMRMDVRYLTGYGDIEDDFTLLKTDSSTSIDFHRPFATDFSVFPNPVHEEVQIALEVAQNSEITIDLFDAQGKQISRLHDAHVSPGKNSFSWNFAQLNLASGTYNIVVSDGKNRLSRKLHFIGRD